MALSIIICSVPCFASAAEKSTEQKATDLNNMGLYAGTDPNKFTPDLNASLTREQGIALAIRLMGLEEDALAMTDADVAAALSVFSDSSGVSGWAVKYVAFAVKNSLINGMPGGTLQATSQLTGNQYATLLLRAAGYTVTADSFSQAASTFSGKAGLSASSVQSVANTGILRSNAVDMSYGQLCVAVNGKGTTVIENLISNGAVNRLDAIVAGVVAVAPIFIPSVAAVQFSDVSAVQTQTIATTQLLLTFSADPTTLSIDNITVTGATKGTLTGTGTTRTLTISNVTAANAQNVTVSISSPSGYSISPSSKNAAIVNSFAFTAGTPARYNTALTVSAGAFDNTATYTWYCSSDTVWDGSDAQLTTGTSYTPGDNDIGKYLIVTASHNNAIVAQLATEKAIGNAILQTIAATFPAAATSINLTEFSGSISGIEAAVAIDGTNYDAYFDINVVNGSAVITGLSQVTTSTKVKLRFKETTTSYAGLEKEVSVGEENT